METAGMMFGPGDTVVRNAHVVTMNPLQPRAQALAVRSGRIIAIGSWEQVEPHGGGLPVLDLEGQTVLPGLIDSHAHVLWTALSLATLDASPAKDHPALRTLVAQAVAGKQPGDVIYGMGFTEYALNAERFGPIIEPLDAAAPQNPVFLMGVTGHVSAANSRALELLALPEAVPGVMRDARGRPNGLLASRANSLADEAMRARIGAGARAVESLGLVVEKALSVGITTLHALEGGTSPEDCAVADLLTAIPGLPLRLVLYYQTLDVEKVLELGLPRIGGCILLDGDIGAHTAALSEPYADDSACCGTLYYSQEEIDEFVFRAHRAGLQVAMHAVGDAAVEQALCAYAAALAAHPRRDHRHRIEHCEVIREDQIRRAQRLGAALAIQPPFNLYWPHAEYYPSLGEERAWKADPVRTLIRPGLLVAGGSDSTVTPMGPLIGVHAAVNHSNPAERIGVREALQLYTINAAHMAFEEHEKGSLEVGKVGDFVVLAENPLAVEESGIKDIAVEMTVLGGDIVYRRT